MRQTLKAIALNLDESFKTEIKKIRSTLKINLESEEGYGSKDFITPALNKEVDRLMSEFDIGKSAKNYLTNLILEGEVFQDPIGSVITMDLREGVEYSIRVNKDTSFSQVKKSFDQIRKKLNPDKKETRHKEYIEFDRDYRMCQMDHEGRRVEEISRAIKKEYGDDLDFGTIPKLISSFRKRFGIQKPVHHK